MHLLITSLVVVILTQQMHQPMHGIQQQLKPSVVPTLLRLTTGLIHAEHKITLDGLILTVSQVKC